MKGLFSGTILFLLAHTFSALGASRYVDLNSASPTAPYTDWATAARTIQDAVDASSTGDLILVTNGVYNQGSRVISGSMANRVAINKAVTVQSVNGAAVTVIEGIGPIGDTAVRCVYMTNSSRLVGFTLTNGATRMAGDFTTERSGGGVWCQSSSVILSNCVFVANSANYQGGGAYRGTLRRCVFGGNTAGMGGGAENAGLSNCLLTNNYALNGGATDFSSLVNCTVVSNTALLSGGGSYQDTTVNNCVVYYNAASSNANFQSSTMSYSCTSPMPGPRFGVVPVGIVTNEPGLASLATGDYRLASNSPCINSGKNPLALSGGDIDFNPRLAGGTVDIGAYEFQTPASVLSYAWAQRNGLATDGSADYLDPDGDGMNNWKEWRSDTIPTNSLSLLRLITVTSSAPNLIVSWQSQTNRSYWVERTADAAGSFGVLRTNITGFTNATSYTDTNAVGNGPFFYRVGVHE